MRLSIIGEAPGTNEVEQGRPFVGASGRLLWQDAAKYGIDRAHCLVANVCQVQPPSNHIEAFSWSGIEIQSGLRQLAADLEQFKPNLCLLLGNTPLYAFSMERGISNWRGSLFNGVLNGKSYKCLASLHPAAILREYSGRVLLDFDLRRAAAESKFAVLSLPERDLRIGLTPQEQLDALNDILVRKPTISLDLEGYWNNLTCISVAESPTKCFLVNFHNHLDEATEGQLWRKLAAVCKDPNIPKILQNALYELFVLQYGHSIPLRGIVDDTMLAWWELYCELPKRLGTQASILTGEPFWKDEREDESKEVRDLYCCKDSAVTYEIRNAIRAHPSMTGRVLDHYRFNLALLEPITYMECRGIAYDKEKAQNKIKTITHSTSRLQWALDSIAGYKHPTNIASWVDISRDTLCYKRESSYVNLATDVVPHAKTTSLAEAVQASEVLSHAQLSVADIGQLATLTSHGLNVESKKQLADFLYRDLGLPVQYKKEHGRRTDKETTDVLALLELYRKTSDPTLKLILQIRALRTRCDALAARTDSDGRIRCGYNVVGTETGRLTCYESPTGSGFNLQTATKKDRDLFLPDPGYWMFECDLSGADGWTVAAHCASCGDPTMLDDLKAGVKVANNIALAHRHGGQILKWSRDQLRSTASEIDPKGWLYFASKRVQHGSCYGMGAKTMSDQILKDSYKLLGEPVFVPESTCTELQRLFFTRYPGVMLWHARLKSQLLERGYLISASGHRRTFFGRKREQSGKVNYDTFKDMCADEPQNNTTYATNLALYKLWTDPDNRTYPTAIESDRKPDEHDHCVLRIQPLHQVHDALIGQFRKEDTEWAIGRIRGYFSNVLRIAGCDVTIPFEGAYGESWGNLKTGKI